MENEVAVELRDMPGWVQQAIKDHLHGRRPHCYIRYNSHPSFGPVWHDACRRYLVARRPDGKTMSIASAYYESLINATRTEEMAYMGGQAELPPGGAILELLTYPPTARLYLHPSQAPKVLPHRVELTPRQLKALDIINGVKAGEYRREEFRREGFSPQDVENVIAELQGLGLVARNRAITVEGRNALRAARTL